MTVRSCRLDLTPSAHLMSDGSGSHCRMMSERTRQFSFFTAQITANVSVAPFISTTVAMQYPNVFTYMPSNLQSVSGCNILEKHKVVTLHNWEVAVVDDAFCSLVWFRLCFAFDA